LGVSLFNGTVIALDLLSNHHPECFSSAVLIADGLGGLPIFENLYLSLTDLLSYKTFRSCSHMAVWDTFQTNWIERSMIRVLQNSRTLAAEIAVPSALTSDQSLVWERTKKASTCPMVEQGATHFS
jgi:hypothetical protein